jgi:predicted nucleic acid-binding protein
VTVVYDAGALIAADRSEREVWADHRARLDLGLTPVTTAPVVAQVSRSGRQAQLRRFLRGCEIEPFTEEAAHDVGVLAGQARVADVVDVHIVLVAYRRGLGVLTGDLDDLAPIAQVLPARVPLYPI